MDGVIVWVNLENVDMYIVMGLDDNYVVGVMVLIVLVVWYNLQVCFIVLDMGILGQNWQCIDVLVERLVVCIDWIEVFEQVLQKLLVWCLYLMCSIYLCLLILDLML